jgi:hypothetical protein
MIGVTAGGIGHSRDEPCARESRTPPMEIHLYMLAYRTEALVASHLEPEAFGHYMAVGTRKLTHGNVVFFEVDPKLKSDYFRLAELSQLCVPHPDGSPKRSKYLSIYRVLEHLELAVFGKLYLVTAQGLVHALEGVSRASVDEDDPGPFLYEELCPVTPLVVSSLPPTAFGRFMTDPSNPLFVPRLFWADLLLDREKTGHLADNLPYSERRHIEQCLRDLEGGPKQTKTISRTPDVHAFYRTLGRGFYLTDRTGTLHYPFPAREMLEEDPHWWKSAENS